MSMDQLKETLSLIVSKKAKFKIKGYKSSGSNAVYDLEVQYVGYGLYKDLIEQSLDKVKESPELLDAPQDCDVSEWNIAVNEQVEAFKAFVKIPLVETVAKESVYTTAPEGYLVSTKDPGAFGLRNCRLITRAKVSTEEAQTEPKQAKAKGMKTKFKDMFKARLPINEYVPMLTFSKDKFESIDVI